jgi:hypothetical protein
MDVERLRRYKNLQRPTQNLRDYMSDRESEVAYESRVMPTNTPGRLGVYMV